MTPRPATKERALARRGSERERVVDVGSASGAPNAAVWPADVREAAVALTRLNIARHGLAHRVSAAQGDMLAAVRGSFDLMVANLPYLPERLRLERSYADLRSEPASAVFAPGDGLGPYRRLLAMSEQRLTEGGALVIQYRGRIVEAARTELGGLLGHLEEQAFSA